MLRKCLHCYLRLDADMTWIRKKLFYSCNTLAMLMACSPNIPTSLFKFQQLNIQNLRKDRRPHKKKISSLRVLISIRSFYSSNLSPWSTHKVFMKYEMASQNKMLTLSTQQPLLSVFANIFTAFNKINIWQDTLGFWVLLVPRLRVVIQTGTHRYTDQKTAPVSYFPCNYSQPVTHREKIN